MSDIGGIDGVGSNTPTIPPGPLTVANALAGLGRHLYSSVEISDTVQNLARNLDKLQAFATKITAVSTSDDSKSMAVTGAQYQKDSAILALWGAGSGQTVTLSAAKAAQVATLASYVTSVSVADSRANIQTRIDALQTAAANGVLAEIVQTGTSGYLTITASQLAADQDALGKIKNGAYSLLITGASVSDVLGLDGQAALSANTKVKSIAIVDTTDAIAGHLDDLQRVGLRLKSITQSDPTTHLEVTGDQYKRDKLVLGKIITSDLLDVMDASATQAKALSLDQKVVTVDIQDTAKNIARNWAVLQDLEDSLTSVLVTDQANAISITADQLAGSDALLAKFADSGGQSYKLAITKVSAANATTVAAAHNVDSVDVTDTGTNLVSSLDDLHTLVAAGKLSGAVVSNPRLAMTLDVSRLQGDQLTATQGVLDKIHGGNYRVAVTGAAVSDVAALASNQRLVSFTVRDSSANITGGLNNLYALGSRLGTIEQTDSGVAFQLSQAQLDSRSSVFAKIAGGYIANLTGVSAAKAVSDAKNLHVGTLTVSDTGRNLLAQWDNLRTLGGALTSITKSDAGDLSLSADNYLQGVHDNLVSKFGAGTTFAVTAATVSQAQTVASDSAVTHVDISDESAIIQDNLSALETLVDGGKVRSIANRTPTASLAIAAADLTDAQDVFALIKGGSYSLTVSGVDAAAAKTLLSANHKIVNLTVTGDSATIVANLSDLNALGKKLTSITQTDAPDEILQLTGAAYEQNAAALAKIEGGFLAVLTNVDASKAATFAASNSVSSLSVSDTGAHIAGAWRALGQLGSKLTEVTQSDTANIQMSMSDWSNGQDLRAKFTADPAVSVSAVRTADVATLAADTAVKAIQVGDTAVALSAAIADLAAQAKVTQLVVDDPSVALQMTGETYAASSAILGKVKNGAYAVDLSDVSAADGAALASDSHVASMNVTDTSSAIATHFDALAAAGHLDSITLTDVGGTITLTAAQIKDNSDTLNKIEGSFQLAATSAAMADLPDLANVAEVSSISIADTAENVSTNFSDIVALGGALTQIQFSDASPVLSVSESDWTAGAGAIAKISGTYQIDVTDTVAGDATTVAGNANVNQVTVADAAANIAGQWDALVSLYNEGAGKLTGITLTDDNPLTLTSDQQTAGATMIQNLLADQVILTA